MLIILVLNLIQILISKYKDIQVHLYFVFGVGYFRDRLLFRHGNPSTLVTSILQSPGKEHATIVSNTVINSSGKRSKQNR